MLGDRKLGLTTLCPDKKITKRKVQDGGPSTVNPTNDYNPEQWIELDEKLDTASGSSTNQTSFRKSVGDGCRHEDNALIGWGQCWEP